MNAWIIAATLATAAVLGGCKQPEEERPRVDEAPNEGREETRTIRNTENIGYAGDAIADKVEGAMDAGEAARQRLDAADREQTQ